MVGKVILGSLFFHFSEVIFRYSLDNIILMFISSNLDNTLVLWTWLNLHPLKIAKQSVKGNFGMKDKLETAYAGEPFEMGVGRIEQ